MKNRPIVVLLCVLGTLLFCHGGSPAQTPPAATPPPAGQRGAAGEDEGPASAEEAPTVIPFSISLWGGWFSGGTYLDLPPLAERTQLEEESDDIIRFNGEPFTDQELNPEPRWKYDAPQKKILPGRVLGARLGMYLSDHFHLDLVASYSASRATTSFINSDPDNLDGPFRETLDSDNGFSVYMGGIDMIYDAQALGLFDLFSTGTPAFPSFGFGIGGIINRFTDLEDKTALYFQGNAALNFHLSESVWMFTQANLTTFSFSREELNYGKQVTYSSIRLGVTWKFDTVAPPEPGASPADAPADSAEPAPPEG